ncbi:MAG: D-glycero-alpha-D-manno-heptose-1,7-bisphosphate 7-phosphatase [Candidatus Omnitrophota bacterium]
MKIIFLDRDGVINRYPGHKRYVTRVKDLKILPGALEALKKLTEAGFRIFIISNQAGVGKGLYSQAKLKAITTKLLKVVQKYGAKIHGVFYCTHRSDLGCACRKPKLGLINKAMQGPRLRREASRRSPISKPIFFVGDSIIDVETAQNAGFKSILVLSGREKKRNTRLWKLRPDYIVKDLRAAAEIVLRDNR